MTGGGCSDGDGGGAKASEQKKKRWTNERLDLEILPRAPHRYQK